jgi:1-deoxy-D-xylulose-5-phosphate reductoisomerase
MGSEVIGIAILGSTGSIGRQTLEVVDRFPERLRVVALAASSNADAVLDQAERYGPALVTMMSEPAARHLRDRWQGGDIASGMDGLVAAASHPEADIVVVSVNGAIGLVPTLAAIEH